MPAEIPDGTEYAVVETVRRTAGQYSWFHESSGETHAELRESLADSRGTPIAVGPFPPFWINHPDVMAAIVPDEHGKVNPGVY
jgi:hypothetical protein